MACGLTTWNPASGPSRRLARSMELRTTRARKARRDSELPAPQIGVGVARSAAALAREADARPARFGHLAEGVAGKRLGDGAHWKMAPRPDAAQSSIENGLRPFLRHLRGLRGLFQSWQQIVGPALRAGGARRRRLPRLGRAGRAHPGGAGEGRRAARVLRRVPAPRLPAVAGENRARIEWFCFPRA